MSAEMAAAFCFGIAAGAGLVSSYYAATAGLVRWIYADFTIVLIAFTLFLVVAL